MSLATSLRARLYALLLAGTMLPCAGFAASPLGGGDTAADGSDEAATAAGSIDPLNLDTNAITTDLSINVPTSWWVYTGASPTVVSDKLTANGARLTDIEVQSVSSGVPTLSVRMVRNSGSYAVSGWWWYYGLTAADVTTKLNANTARLIDIEPYDIGGGSIRFAVIMVSNTASAARTWAWYYGKTSSQITSLLSGKRLIDLDSYNTSSGKRYTAIMIANTGADLETWEWWLNQSTTSIASKVAAFSGRVIKLDRQSDGTYNFIQVKNTGSEATAWWYYFGFTSTTALLNYANQLAVRPVDIVTYLNSSGSRRWDASFIDNANASTRRMRSEFAKNFLDANGNPTRGIFEAYLKQVDGSVKVNLNSTRRAETASSLKSLHLLHSMRRVAASTDTLASAFTYYEYDPVKGKDACPNPALETNTNKRTNYNFEKGLDEMMRISDNRTTRGTVIRYGGFSPFNSTAGTVGMNGTTMRHNIGCAYYNLSTDKYDATNLRNDTTAADLARIYEGVWNSSLLSNTNSARSEFLESANPATGVSAELQAIINDEAAKLGKSAIAAEFGGLVKRWGKGGSYNTCLPDSAGACGTKVIVRSGAGLIQIPAKSSGAVVYRNYVFGRFISDSPVPNWGDSTDTKYSNAYSAASNELYRDEIRSALQTW